MSSKAKKPIYIPLFPDAYLRDTMHLTTEEHGTYFLLLMAAYGTEDCSLPHDEKKLAQITRLSLGKWRSIAPTILEFWTIQDGKMRQSRLLKEWNYVQEKREQARAAVQARWDREKDTAADTPVGASDDTGTIHLGGGGGGGPSSDVGEGRELQGDKPFRLIKSGGEA